MYGAYKVTDLRTQLFGGLCVPSESLKQGTGQYPHQRLKATDEISERYGTGVKRAMSRKVSRVRVDTPDIEAKTSLVPAMVSDIAGPDSSLNTCRRKPIVKDKSLLAVDIAIRKLQDFGWLRFKQLEPRRIGLLSVYLFL
ncbi:hypothetical protein PM082_019007 [Marasmius tenuissimus]|nr:hypothetical protein PM082_019007 [Marasmius tenuissimus]